MDFSKHLFRCHVAGILMVNPKDKEDREKGLLGATCKNKLRTIHRELKWNRVHKLDNKFIEKGLGREESAITLLSRVKKKYLTKNTERINNKFLSGEPDLFLGKDIFKTPEGWDTKCSWDWQTFPYPDEKLDLVYYWQNQSYIALTGAKKWTTAFCLVNTPAHLIDDEKRRFLFKSNLSQFDPAYIEECKKIERNCIYDLAAFMREFPHYDLMNDKDEWIYDIPMKERVIEFAVERNDEDIQRLYNRIIQCRNYLTSIDSPHILFAQHSKELSATIIEGKTISINA